MIDTWLYTWPDLDIWFCYWLPLLLSIYVCILFQSYSSIYYHHMLTRYMHVHLPLHFTLIVSLSDYPGFERPDWMLYFIVQVFDETVHIARSWSLSLNYRYSCSFIYVISWFSLYRIQLPFHFLFICYHVWIFICSIAVIMIYYNLFGLL